MAPSRVPAQDLSRSRIFPRGETGFSLSKLLQRGSRTPPEQSSPDSELRWSSLRGKGDPERTHAGGNSSKGNPAIEINPGR
jgi:hypothetical protein